jgi:two-component system response regulator
MCKEFKSSISDVYEGYQEEIEEKDTPHPHKNILLIEQNNNDELLFRQALMEFPEKFNILSCHNGEEALNLFRNLEEKASSYSSKPNLVFLDLNLPVINGFDVLKNIKRRQSLQNIPVIVFTRDYCDEDIIRSYGLHANGFINISLSYKEIKQQFHKALSYWIQTVELPA